MKTFALFLAIVLAIPSFLQAQESESEQTKKVIKSRLGIHINTGTTNQIFEDPELGKSLLSFRHGLGIDYFYHISPNVEFKTGLSYYLQILNQSDLSLILPCDFYPAGIDYPEGINYAFSRYDDRFKIHYIGIPIEVKFNFSKKANHFYTKLGVESQYRLSQSSIRELIECDLAPRVLHPAQSSRPKAFVVQTNVGIGIEFELVKCTRMYLESQASYTINPIYVDPFGDNNSRLLNLGIILGVKL